MGEMTGAERYIDEQLQDPAFRAGYDVARREVDSVDRVIRALDARRAELGLSKAELARRAGMTPDVVRRLFTSGRSNPTLRTVAALGAVLGLSMSVVDAVTPAGAGTGAAVTPTPADAGGTRRRSA
jgi:DNA-binding phage protein